MSFRPLLAPPNSPKDTPTFFEDIKFPILVSPKLDGIRAVVMESDEIEVDANLNPIVVGSKIALLSRTLKRLRNEELQQKFSVKELLHLDGELIVGEAFGEGVLNRTQSYVRAAKAKGDISYHIFDYADEKCAGEHYFIRLDRAKEAVSLANDKYPEAKVFLIPQINCESLDELLHYEGTFLSQGFEGVMFRNPLAHYKHNRATYLDNIIYKLKRFTDVEVKIVGFVEGTINTNEQTVDERGFATRSSHKEGKMLSGALGKFICLFEGREIFVASGYLTATQKKHIWENQEKFLGATITMRYFGYNILNELRYARFVAFRESWDM